ncbi:hypothetical protein [Streptomyces sioyaensis]|uniref:hypothetical protein n=1 Tax=Streptomyces sioyaensis TaxID=67364 RepID=UPI00379A92BD
MTVQETHPLGFGGRVVSSLTATARSARPRPERTDGPGFPTGGAEVIHWSLCPDRSSARSS